TNRPVYTKAIFSVGFKIKITPAVALSAPQDGSPAHLIAAQPDKGLCFHIGAFLVIGKRTDAAFECKTAPKDAIMFFLFCQRKLATMFELPGIFIGVLVIFDVFKIPSAFKHDGLQSFFGELFGGPSAADAGSNDNGIVCILKNCLGHGILNFSEVKSNLTSFVNKQIGNVIGGNRSWQPHFTTSKSTTKGSSSTPSLPRSSPNFLCSGWGRYASRAAASSNVR